MNATVRALPTDLRRKLESAVLAARRAAESATRASLDALGVFAERRPEHLSAEQAALRNGLRAKARQLGGERDLLVAECAYEQWHRLLFARFLAENDLLLHPEFQVPVTLEDCADLAAELGEPDAWSVASRFAAEILPRIFRLDDPCVQLRFAPEGRHALEQIVDSLPAEVFRADDSLGWVYQFWQKDRKDEINRSERKIGGADLGPVTQLFTENYMVRFLLENSLGAWWAARHPDSPLVAGFEYLRFDDDGRPAAGCFDGWPDRVAEVTVMDPCCGSGHFLVEAFSMLWRMRAEEEGVSPVEAQDAALRDNLFGLELDARCVQIAMFAVAFQAWKAGGGWRLLPAPNIACSGLSNQASLTEWIAIAKGDTKLEDALRRLHLLFRHADSLGSLIDPLTEAFGPASCEQKSLYDTDWDTAHKLLDELTSVWEVNSQQHVLAVDVNNTSHSAALLAQKYTLVVTNVPFLSRRRQSEVLQHHLTAQFEIARSDLATAMLVRWARVATTAIVSPQQWQAKVGCRDLRAWLLTKCRYPLFAWLGNDVWQTQSGAQPFKMPTVLSIFVPGQPGADSIVSAIDIGDSAIAAKAHDLTVAPVMTSLQQKQLLNNEHRITTTVLSESEELLALYADSFQGTSTGDNLRYCRNFWELPAIAGPWRRLQSTVISHVGFGGREQIVLWGGDRGVEQAGSAIRGRSAWGRRGMAISQMGRLYTTEYTGDLFDSMVAALIPKRPEYLAPIRAFVTSPEFNVAVRQIDQSVKVPNATLVQVPFDLSRWRRIAQGASPQRDPWTDDATQWLFAGRPEMSSAPLQIAVGRLLGYRWPEQAEPDELDVFTDSDGIVCIPAVAGEARGADRVQQLLAAAYRDAWSTARLKNLLEKSGSKKKNIAEWLRDEFFKQHCALFANRPFVWHIWDGLQDGFSALVNYHGLDHRKLQKLTYTYLGQDWMERQRDDAAAHVPGAEARLDAAQRLKRKLELIVDGEARYDIYVRWKELHEQPIGWNPDFSDGVRLNIRPFVQAGVLRTAPNVKWTKDRGKNPDGSERINDRHLTLAEKDAARRQAGRA